ncbi:MULTISPECIES: LacI family DNA-binding transcriptional regulator [unclassified Shimia]|uniref:LacI family DNA-binding transcriptional regulator n=1 Tax=unclassified Shimia TaxID=2630038 RepID=UPI001ADC7F9C|nr:MULTISPECIES: LacI family DNA-binding transcriptional regulator [unclassified Shimia]MBO9474751.1 LacI family DNA-binding transcriptional regulator [Shimia sp. R10_1]MDA5558514.1 LacI family DNA-binding transcriptional regulator [Shimia sp. MMG029]
MAGEKIRNMEEFARMSGISRPTLSKFFNDPTSVRSSTRSRIEAALAQFDYRPNIYAMNQNRKLTKNIGIVVPLLSDPYFAEIARNLEQRCIDAGYRPTLFSSHGDTALEVEVLQTLRSLKPAGVLLAPLGRASDTQALSAFCDDVPTLIFDSSVDEIGLSFVGSDNVQFTTHITDYLCRTGEPPCFFEMKTPANPNAHRRRQAYIAAMESFGHTPKVVSVPGEGWGFEEIGRLGGHEAIKNNWFSTNTILCSNDRLAIGLLTACYEQGLRVGRTSDCAIRVAGQDGHPHSRYTCPPLTTISHNYDAVSQTAAESLFAAIDGHVSPWKSTRLEGQLILRDSA